MNFQRISAVAAGLAFILTSSCLGNTITDTETYAVGVGIRDNDLNGVANSQNFNSPISSIDSISVTLNISGGYNGDFYVYLTHGSGFSVLLNRAGRTTGNDFGYADSGFSVTFASSGGNGDVHNYGSVLNPGGGILTGSWQADGRNLNPADALDSTSRTALLDSFLGSDPDGEWTLFVADVSPVGTGTLQSWGLTIGGIVPEPQDVSVPDPGGTVWLFGLGLIAVAVTGSFIRVPRQKHACRDPLP